MADARRGADRDTPAQGSDDALPVPPVPPDRPGPSSHSEGSADSSADSPHAPYDRAAVRALFVELSTLPDGAPARAELRIQLVRMHLPLVEHHARRFRNRGEPLDDLTQVGVIGLIKAVDRFDVERGVEFATYATPPIVGEIKRHFRDKGWAVRVPRRLQELRLALTTATAELSQEFGRSPTVHELAGRLAISEQEVLDGLESANAYSTLSPSVDLDEESPAAADALATEDQPLEAVEHRESLQPLLEDLPPRERRIVLLRFFSDMTQAQIAQEIGVSQTHVSRLLARTLAQLQRQVPVEDDDTLVAVGHRSRAGGTSAAAPAPRARCRAQLTLLDDDPRTGTPARLTVGLAADPGHAWARPGARPVLAVVAAPLSSADVTPATALLGPARGEVARFSVLAGEPGIHRIRFTFFHHDTGMALHQVETDIEVAVDDAAPAAPAASPQMRPDDGRG